MGKAGLREYGGVLLLLYGLFAINGIVAVRRDKREAIKPIWALQSRDNLSVHLKPNVACTSLQAKHYL
jgi:hypothetical protein